MKHFTLRVYGILIQNGKVLISDEYCGGMNVTKFPGGGLEFGEGTIECVIREFKEELDLEIEVIDHFHTTDFFTHSAFDSNKQVICIYYLVKPKENKEIITSETPYDFIQIKEGAQSFRWLSLHQLNESFFTFATDKKVSQLLNKTHN